MDSKISTNYPPAFAGIPFAERRQEPRFKAEQFASVTPLMGTAESLAARVLDISAQGMKLNLPCSLPVGAPIKIDLRSDMVLGEVRYCIPADDGSSEIGIEIDQILKDVREVARRCAEVL